MIEKIAAFDLEISKIITPEEFEGHDLMDFRPFGISCAAIEFAGVTTSIAGDIDSIYPTLKMYPKQWTPEECRLTVDGLEYLVSAGYKLFTWNGVRFDFDVLAEECQSEEYKQKVIALTMSHIDIAFTILCARGFTVGLDTAAKGMGVSGKTEGMHGDQAPVLWAKDRESQDEVMAYNKQDAIATMNVARAVGNRGYLQWMSKSGSFSRWTLPTGRLLTVSESLALPLPNTSWMDKPWKREDFTKWMGVSE